MRFFILLMVLLIFVSCQNEQIPGTDMVMNGVMDESSMDIPSPEDSDRFPEITISPGVHQVLQPGTYRMILNGFQVSESRLESVYISSDSGDVLDVLRIKFNPQPWIFTADDEFVVRLGEEVVVGIKSGPEIFTEEPGAEVHNVVEYEGTAIANLTRPNIIFEVPSSVEPDKDDDDEDDVLSTPDDDDEDDVLSTPDDIDENTDEEPQSTDQGTPMPDGIETLDSYQRAALLAFGKNDRVKVKNTLDEGLKIRSTAGGTRIGGMFNGEIGTIISDPEIASDYVWFKIEWDRPVKDPRSGCGDREVCVGWSAAVLRDGTEVLDLLE